MRARLTKVEMAAGEAIRRGWELASQLANIRFGDPRSKRFHAFGPRSVICFPMATILGYDRISIGSDTLVAAYSTLSAGLPLQPPKPEWAGPTLVVGDRCVLGRNTTITAHHEIVIEDDVWLGTAVFISDQNHGWDDSDRPIGAQAQEPRPVRIGAGSWIGNGAMVLPGANLGRRVIVAAGAVVTQPVPDHAIVAGVPARVISTTGSDDVVVPMQQHGESA